MKEFVVEDVGPNVFLFHFLKLSDCDLMMKQHHWNIQGNLLVVQPSEPEMTFPKIAFLSSPFWIQIRGLPRNRMHEVNARFIKLKLGQLVEIDTSEYLNVSKYAFSVSGWNWICPSH